MRVNSVAHPTFIIAATEHAGHRRNAELLDVFTRVNMVLYIHDHLRFLAVDHKLECARYARAVEKRIHGKGGCARFNRFEPERGEIRKLFFAVGVGIYRQTAGR